MMSELEADWRKENQRVAELRNFQSVQAEMEAKLRWRSISCACVFFIIVSRWVVKQTNYGTKFVTKFWILTVELHHMAWEGSVNPRVKSHKKATAGKASGKFKDEIISVHTKLVDPKTGEEKKVVISKDDGIRPETTVADLAKLKTVFKKFGSTTAGNALKWSVLGRNYCLA